MKTGDEMNKGWRWVNGTGQRQAQAYRVVAKSRARTAPYLLLRLAFSSRNMSSTPSASTKAALCNAHVGDRVLCVVYVFENWC